MATARRTSARPALGLERSFWTPLLLLLTGLFAVLRAELLLPAGTSVDSELELGAYLGSLLGAWLMPWAFAALVAYGHWFWNKTRRDRQYMAMVYPYRRRAVLHGAVLLILLLMASEVLWHLLNAEPLEAAAAL